MSTIKQHSTISAAPTALVSARTDGASPLILGHRGSREAPTENLPSAFAQACQLQNQGLAGIEFDVQLSADGQLVIFHDDTLVRLGRRQSRIDQLTLAEIRRIRIQNQSLLALKDIVTHPLDPVAHTPLTLSSAKQSAALICALMRFRHIELEVKTHERTTYAELIRALEETLLNLSLSKLPLVLTSFDLSLLARLQQHRTLCTIPRGLLTDDPALLPQLSHIASRLGCCRVGVYHPLIDHSLLSQCRRANLAMSAWTVNDPQDAYRLSALGVEVIITDYPTSFLTLF